MEVGKEINIVLIDGNEMELMLISEALKKLHIIYRIVPFNNVQKALEYFDHQTEMKPHLIIVDSDTMHISGEYFISKLRSSDKLRNIPLWILTDNEGEEVFFSYLNLPAKSFIVKPGVFKKHKDMGQSYLKSSDKNFKNRYN